MFVISGVCNIESLLSFQYTLSKRLAVQKCSHVTVKTSERRHWSHSTVFIPCSFASVANFK